MQLIEIEQTLILNKQKTLPAQGIICAHPARALRIAKDHLLDFEIHTNYRGFQVYTGIYDGKEIFVANTGLGASAAAFLIEELSAFGVKRILRLGSHDGHFKQFCLKVVQETTLPLGLCADYEYESTSISISSTLIKQVTNLAYIEGMKVELCKNRHLDSYHAINFFKQKNVLGFNSQDMESGALYLIAQLKEIECLSILISYPKHETGGEYLDNGKSQAYEGRAIEFALKLLLIN